MSRASDDTREQTVALLRKGLLAGRLGTDTFVERVDAAYRAKSHEELVPVTDDLPRPRRPWHTLAGLFARPPANLEAPAVDVGESRVIGRARSCDYAIADPTVSTRHAELVRVADGWLIRDLGSLNGTRVNGWLVKEQRLRPGDTLALGGASFTFRARA